ncbi:MAG: exopolyphosphatase / guanosine-5-triphosphate,3-diphosphate pyrophosphatase [Campylobacterota bacterium]|nr:exopolyphosphatase / guanosine-5-triphosphate,3-diphosphate pyrophosphatase [Campylobacterota bacterium]
MIAVDLGSNTLRVVQFDCKSQKCTAEYEKIVKTADGLAQYGSISDEAVGRVIDAINEVKAKIDFGRDKIRAVTTQAVRSAANSEAVIAKIKEYTGVEFEIISGEEEAALTLLAVKKRLDSLQHVSKSFVLVDIGGGSTELIFHYSDKVVAKSFPVGIVTIAQSYSALEEIENALPELMLQIQIFCAEIYAAQGKVDSFVATAGTPTTVAAMKMNQSYATYDAQKINGTLLERNELDFFLDKLLSMPFEQREYTVGTGRSDLIAAGILIFKQLYNITGFEHCIVVDDGLREGVALRMCNKL